MLTLATARLDRVGSPPVVVGSPPRQGPTHVNINKGLPKNLVEAFLAQLGERLTEELQHKAKISKGHAFDPRRRHFPSQGLNSLFAFAHILEIAVTTLFFERPFSCILLFGGGVDVVVSFFGSSDGQTRVSGIPAVGTVPRKDERGRPCVIIYCAAFHRPVRAPVVCTVGQAAMESCIRIPIVSVVFVRTGLCQ